MSGRRAGSSSAPGPDRRIQPRMSRSSVARLSRRHVLTFEAFHLGGYYRWRPAQELEVGLAVPHHTDLLGIDFVFESPQEVPASLRVVGEHVSHHATGSV